MLEIAEQLLLVADEGWRVEVALAAD